MSFPQLIPFPSLPPYLDVSVEQKKKKKKQNNGESKENIIETVWRLKKEKRMMQMLMDLEFKDDDAFEDIKNVDVKRGEEDEYLL